MNTKYARVIVTSARCSSFGHYVCRRSFRSFHQGYMRCAPIVPFKLADIGEGITQVEILQWFVREGQSIRQFENVCQVQSDKATVEITSRFDGIVRKVHYQVGESAQVGKALIDIQVEETSVGVSGGSACEKMEQVPGGDEVIQMEKILEEKKTGFYIPETAHQDLGEICPSKSEKKILAAPSVRRLAKEHEVNLSELVPTGSKGHLIKEDLLKYIKSRDIQKEFEHPAYLQEDTILPIDGLRKNMFETMSRALQIPHFGYADEIQMDAVHNLREEMAKSASARNHGLSYMPFLIKAASLALKHYPMLNARISDCQTKLTLVAAHNVSVAIDTPDGLVVPNVKNVQSKGILEIADELNRLQKLSIEKKLAPSDIKNGTFTLSNIGSIGGTYTNPVLLNPQVAIGAVGRIQTLPRYDEEWNIAPMRLMNVSWSGDHRVIDGATMCRFSNLWKTYLERPTRMLSEMS